MKKLGKSIEYLIADLTGNSDQAKINIRARQVRNRYKEIIELIYRDAAELFLKHTNNVYIIRGDASPLSSANTSSKTGEEVEKPATPSPSHENDAENEDQDSKGKDRKTLIVYVDESIFSAELNAQRELIKLKFLELFGEELDDFKIYISRGVYKSHHPFENEEETPAPPKLDEGILDETEMQFVESMAKNVESPEVSKSLKKAMTADLGRKKMEKRILN